MTIELLLDRTATLAQTVHVRSHELVADVSQAEGGGDTGPSPHDLYDAALGACKALTVMWYARKKGIPVDDIQTRVERDAADERKGIYRLTTTLKVHGALSDAQLKELEAVARKCPVHKLMTTVTTEITTRMERLP
ncbi:MULTISPECIES: OsmC family protein [unclassified Polaromonas]|uniref:OsmC family protein n=1 Tax=unclassified Polaromonas TaxID=2638319 RepID=UPI0018C90240|nr:MULTISPECIES: OsmC family protein [unclassified Polaromonas]MBG6071113.1 putative redox protein [Polaromonas sp. CG_9.7]MBG6113113.1 putative redox protein [Polaromonas sp. CG_9.2]MDH6185645.1 putative redox protein [Polaromonas sp. CG_23.6]